MGRKMMASLASGILVQTAARTVMIAPDWETDETTSNKCKQLEPLESILTRLNRTG